jgi:hypothetical protein
MSCATRSVTDPTCLAARGARVFICALLLVACSKEEDQPFARVTLAAAEADPNPGYVWFHRKPGQPLPGARYEAGFDVKAQFGLGVCRAKHNGSMIPGRTYGQQCSVPIDGKEVLVDEYDALVARAGALWHVEASQAPSPDSALLAGRDASGKPLYSCVAVHVSGWFFKTHHGFQPGVYRDGKCEFAFDGKAVLGDHFFVLATVSPRKEKAPAEPAPADAGSTTSANTADAATTPSTTAAVADAAPPLDAASSATDAGDASVDAGASDGAASAQMPEMEPEPELPFPPAPPAVCMTGETPCPCERYNGCSRPGLCICRL